MNRHRLSRVLLWAALLALPWLVVVHAFEHPVLADAGIHGCTICQHGQGGTLPPPPTAPRAERPQAVPVRAPIPRVAGVAPIRPAAHHPRGPPDLSLS